MKDRLLVLKEFIDKNGKISLKELAVAFPEVSAMTLRRDLARLEENNDVIRIPGGAVSVDSFLREKEAQFSQRINYMAEEKVEIAEKASKLVVNNSEYKGIFICGSGVGVCMVANRHKGIRAVLAYDSITAEMSRKHNNANVLCLGQTRVSPSKSLKIIKIFLNTEFEGGRHLKRIEKF